MEQQFRNVVTDTSITADYSDFLIYSPRWRRPMKSTSLLLSLFFAISLLAQSPTASQNPTEPTKQTQPPPPPPTKRLFIADYIISGVVGSAQTTNGSTYGSAAVVGRNISLEATDGFIKRCPAVTVTSDKDAADYILRPNKGSSTLYKKNGDVAYVSHAKVKVSNLVKDVCGYIQAHP
jgi:hypothetical protein